MAFRYVLGALVYFGAIVAAASIATWLGLVVFVLASVVAVYVIRGGGSKKPMPGTADDSSSPAAVADTHRVIVLLSQPRVGPRLRDALVTMTADVPEDVLLVHPLPAGESGDEVDELLAEAVSNLATAGVSARAESYAGDPVAALEHVVGRASADEIVVSVPSPAAEWLRDGIPDAARGRFSAPVRVVAERGHTSESEG
jgi:hypothetical protein